MKLNKFNEWVFMDDKNKKTDEVIFKIGDDSDIEKAIDQLNKMRKSSNSDSVEHKNKDNNNITKAEAINIIFETYKKTNDPFLKKILIKTNFENSNSFVYNEKNNSNNTIYFEDNIKSDLRTLKALSNIHFYMLLIGYLIGIFMFVYISVSNSNSNLNFSNLITLNNEWLYVLLAGFIYGIVIDIFCFAILSNLKNFNPKIKDTKLLRTLFIFGIFTGIIGIVASGILSFDILKGIETRSRHYFTNDFKIDKNRLYENNNSFNVDESKLNSLKNFIISFVTISFFALLAYIAYIFLGYFLPTSINNSGIESFRKTTSIIFTIEMISLACFLLSLILVCFILYKSYSLSEQTNFGFKIPIVVFSITISIIVILTIFDLIGFDILLNSVTNFLATLFSLAGSLVTISKIKEIKNINSRY
ncbi:MAG: hypothetical protein K2I76_01715 [Malacoplasma sp.]|nr:hypothetical protein [Malacoplasma sp.]